MNIFPKREAPVDMDQLERDVRQTWVSSDTPLAQAEAYTPKKERYAPLQVIGHAITKLTWSDAEIMGKAIEAKAKHDPHEAPNLTAAIQAWAEGWESFGDD